MGKKYYFTHKRKLMFQHPITKHPKCTQCVPWFKKFKRTPAFIKAKLLVTEETNTNSRWS